MCCILLKRPLASLQVIELREWNQRFRIGDPVITPKGQPSPLKNAQTSRQSTPPNRLNFNAAAAEEEGKKCRFLQKPVSGLTPERHTKQLTSTPTATEKKLARAIDELQEGAGRGAAATDAGSAEERLGEMLKKTRAELIATYVEMMRREEEEEEEDEEIPEEADGYDEEGWDLQMPDDGEEEEEEEDDDEMI